MSDGAMFSNFGGRIGATPAESTPWWPTRQQPPQDAPNVLVIVLDDVGFAQLGCYGAPFETPHMDALAENGTQYSNFHVAAMCSPTRASLLTGRNHHSVGMGCLADFDTGYPNQTGAVSHDAATLAEMLRPHGYHNYCVGKWHLAPYHSVTPVGPFDQWPLGRGFDHYYGFLWGETDEWRPQLWRDNHSCETPLRDGYHLSEDLADEAIRNISDVISSGSANPFFMYLAFGAGHAPHQAPQTYIDKYRGRFDEGWDVVREQVLRRQIELGVVPEGTKLSPRNDDVAAWESLGADERRLYARMQEVFAGYMEHTDAQIGRLMDFLQTEGLIDNTLVVLLSDNGASGEGGKSGSWNEYRYFLGLPDDLAENIAAIDKLGGPAAHNHYPTGWAQAGNAPGKYYKKFTHAGGIRTPLIIQWPDGSVGGGIQKEFRYVTDLVPTVLDAIGVDAPEYVNGIQQMPIHGHSFSDSLRGETQSDRGPQYFEMIGNRAMWRDGWKAVTRHIEGTQFEEDVWELYDIANDFSETNNLADQHPDILAELRELWWVEAWKYGVLPLDDRLQGRADVRRQTNEPERRLWRFLPGTSPIMSQAGPDFYDRSFTVTATISRATLDGCGVLMAQGHRANGWSLFVKDNHLMLDYNLAGRHTILKSSTEIPVGECTLIWNMVRSGSARAAATLLIDGHEVAASEFPTIPSWFGPHSVQCGRNAPSPISAEYDSPFAFTEVLRHVSIELADDKERGEGVDLRAALGSE